MLVGAENEPLDGGGRRGGTEEELCMVVLVGLKVEEVRELGGTGLAPNGFRFETVGRNAGLDVTTGVDGKDAVCVAGGGDIVGVVTWEVQ